MAWAAMNTLAPQSPTMYSTSPAVSCPGVKIAAVVGVPHPKWEERPLLVIEAHDGHAVNREAVLDFLSTRIVKWWMPDDVVFASIPLTATGKIDKKVLRDLYRAHLMAAE